jgi:hypothetical protein
MEVWLRWVVLMRVAWLPVMLIYGSFSRLLRRICRSYGIVVMVLALGRTVMGFGLGSFGLFLEVRREVKKLVICVLMSDKYHLFSQKLPIYKMHLYNMPSYFLPDLRLNLGPGRPHGPLHITSKLPRILRAHKHQPILIPVVSREVIAHLQELCEGARFGVGLEAALNELVAGEGALRKDALGEAGVAGVALEEQLGED